MKKLLTIIGLACGLASLTIGCSAPSHGHIIRGVATGTKVGIVQDPATGMYSFGIQRVQTEVTSIPIQWNTNGTVTVPDVVSGYEVSTHSAIFGNAALTSRMSTGTNGVQSVFGSQAPPINEKVGVGSNIPSVAK